MEKIEVYKVGNGYYENRKEALEAEAIDKLEHIFSNDSVYTICKEIVKDKEKRKKVIKLLTDFEIEMEE